MHLFQINLTNNLYGLISLLFPFRTQLTGVTPGSLILFGSTLAWIANWKSLLSEPNLVIYA
jgi:hypothetical protein